MLTPWRKELYNELSSIKLDGKVLDLGGSGKSGYHSLIKGNHNIFVANIDDEYGYDLKIDLENPFPLDDHSYDNLLVINVLEHIYNYQDFIFESYRILKDEGSIVIGVPFLLQIHPCPHDYLRYTEETLVKSLSKAGFKEINVKPIGKGPFTASTQILFNSLRFNIIRLLAIFIANILDRVIGLFKDPNKLLSEYPLGYIVTAKK